MVGIRSLFSRNSTETAALNVHDQVYTEKSSSDGVITAGVKDMIVVENSGQYHCFDTVSSVTRYPEFLSLYENVVVLEDQGMNELGESVKIVRYNIHVPLIFSAFLRELHYTLRLVTKVGPEESYMKWTQVDGPSFVKENVGHWTSRQVGPNVELGLEMELGYKFYLPSHLKNYIQSTILRDTLASIKKRAQDTQTSFKPF
ncbi:bis(5'-nucleosyl)-tetraphosphatase, symmetrical [Acrasis kona]|uniref:Bis(5'-nucleosyl)-tetraphosphatase, symmetrical n=1 Tax=Acrasis kona TaxID=1008807 RepID=A0AAW2ZLT4_9EUKA